MAEKGRLKRIAGGLSAHRWRAESTTSQPQWIVLMPRAVRPSLIRSVKEIEELTGFKFFRNLDPAVADAVKSQKNLADW